MAQQMQQIYTILVAYFLTPWKPGPAIAGKKTGYPALVPNNYPGNATGDRSSGGCLYRCRNRT